MKWPLEGGLASGLLLVIALLGRNADAATAEEWRSRSIYQVLTDRFARSDQSTDARCNTEDRLYCGGSYQGLVKRLDYIQNMGFTAVSLAKYHHLWTVPITGLG
jgi:alpha-amylase